MALIYLLYCSFDDGILTLLLVANVLYGHCTYMYFNPVRFMASYQVNAYKMNYLL